MADNIIVRVKSRLRVPPAPTPPLDLTSPEGWLEHWSDTRFEHLAVDLAITGTILGIEFDPNPRDLAFVHELTNAYLSIRTESHNWLGMDMRAMLGAHQWPTTLRVARGERLDITLTPARRTFDLWGYEGAVTFTLALTGAVGLERHS